MKLRDLNISYLKGKPPRVKEGAKDLPYLTPEYLRGKQEAVFYPDQPNIVKSNDNEVILLWDGSNAGEFFKSKHGILASTMVKFQEIEGFSNEYFFYSMKGIEETLKSKTAGSGIPHVDKDILRDLEIYEADKKEQQAITAVLSKVDQAIEKTEQLIAKYENIKTGMIHDLLTKGLDEAGNIRSEETHDFKDSELGRIPVEWEVIKVGEIANIIDPQPDHRTPKEDKDGFPYVGIGDIDNMGRVSDDCRKIVQEAYEKQKSRYTLKTGDIIFGKIGTIGNPKRIGVNRNIALSANIMLAQPLINKEFMYQVLNSKYVIKQVFDSIHSTTQPAFGMGKMRNLKIARPKKAKEELLISVILKAMEKWLLQESNNLSKLKSLKTALMQDLLTGKKSVEALIGQPEETQSYGT